MLSTYTYILHVSSYRCVRACVYLLVNFNLCFLHSGAPQFVDLSVEFAIEGDTLTVNCCIMSFPQPTVSLTFKGTVLSASVSGGYDNVSRLFRYYITYSTMAMQSNDEGNYTVSATVTHGQPAVTEVFTKTVFVAVYGGSCSHLSMRGHVQHIVIYSPLNMCYDASCYTYTSYI